MKFREFAIKALPYIAAVAVFWIVSALYFAPQFEDKTLSMTDVQMYEGGKKDISLHRAATGEDPQWTGRMFGGMPAYMITVEYPAMILRNGAQRAMNTLGEPAALMFLAMLGFWLMLTMCGVNPWVAIPAALAYGLSTYNILIIEAGHITKMRAMGYAPMLVGAVFWTFRRNVWIGGALAALFGTLTIAAAHPQITYYFLLIIAAYWVSELVFAARGRNFRRFGISTGVLVLAAIMAVGANFTHLWYTFEHSPETIRGGSELAEGSAGSNAGGLDSEYATAWSYGVGESFNMFIAGFRGGGSSETFDPRGEVADALGEYGIPEIATQLSTYWGEQPVTGGPTYIGAVVVFLCILGLFVLPARQKWWVAAVSVLGLLLAWGKNAMWFTQFAFVVLPGYDKFRTVSMALVILQWSVPFLAAMVMSKLWSGEFDRARLGRGLVWALGIAGGMALLFAVLGGSLMDLSSPTDFDRMYGFALRGGLDERAATVFADDVVGAMSTERLELLRADSWRSLLMVVLAGAGTALFLVVSGKRRWLAVAAIGVLVLADLVPVDHRYVSHDDFMARSQVTITADAADEQILADTEPGFRVLNTANPFNEAYTSYFHRSVGGYHGVKLSRYQDVIDRYLSKMDMGVLDMLNTKYIISADPATGKRQARLNPDANGAAWFVDGLVWADGAREEIDALSTVDMKREAVADRRFEGMAGGVSLEKGASLEGADSTAVAGASIELVEYRPNYLKYEASTEHDRLAVFSEIYYDKGWKAYVDGVEAPYFRADYILRAMVVPAGEHTVEWRFRAPHFALVEGITLACSVMILLWLAVAVAVEQRKKTERDGAGR